MRRIVVIALSAILALVVAVPMASAKPNADQGQTIGKKILGELAAEWWTWALEEPTATNPLLGSYTDGPQCDGTFSLNKGREVLFLAGTTTGEPVTRECTVSSHTWLFFPIVNTFQGEHPGVGSEEAFRETVNTQIDQFLVNSTMFVTVDGKPVPVSIKKQRADTPLFTFNLPADTAESIFGDPTLAGEYEAVADGVWVLLPPLSEGTHTITFGGTFPNGGFEQNNTYILTVV